MRSSLILLFSSLLTIHAFSQVVNPATPDTAIGVKLKEITLSGYADVYYGGMPEVQKVRDVPYMVNSAVQNALSLNLAYVDVRFNSERVRARIIPAFGTYMDANYVSESGTMKHLLEANAGILLSAKRKIWLDAGLLSSPYTNESAISRDHLMYTRSLAAEFAPYYLMGAKLTIPLGSKWNLYLYGLNGWQQIADQNDSKSLGTQLEFRPNKSHLLNWNTYIGSERSSVYPQRAMRYFTDLYWVYRPEGRFSLTSCAYIGVQEFAGSNALDPAVWWQANMMGKWQFNNDWSVAARGELFSDERNVMLGVPFNGVTTTWMGSGSFNVTKSIAERAQLRWEVRRFFSDGYPFPKGEGNTANGLWWLVANATVWF